MRKLSFSLFVALLALPSVALAGGCPTCATSSDCMPPGSGPAYCVEWSRDFGCGAQRIACCPGQACAIDMRRRPSCEGVDSDGDGIDDCTVVGGAGVDAGPAMVDAGSVGTDAGSVDSDAGSLGADAGGGGGTDAGTGPVTDGGCGCRVGGPMSSSSSWIVGLIALAGFVRLRAR